jgi:DNA-binding XRE family transcriptional regulator
MLKAVQKREPCFVETVNPKDTPVLEPIDAKKLGRAIRCYRRKTGYNQMQLAVKIGISNTYLCSIEYGRIGHPSFRIINDIVRHLGVSMSDFFLSIENNTYMLKKVPGE